MTRLPLVLLLLILAGCAARPPTPEAAPGIVLPAPGTPAGGEVQPGGPIAPGTIPGQPVPLPDTRPPLNPNLPKSIEASGAAAPVVSLVKAARASLKAGRTDEAGGSLERALRIEPRNPWVWQGLAALHLVTQQAEQAESEAKKSNSLGKRNPYLEVENWRLIAEARRLKGDNAGAVEARERHEDLKALIGP